MNNLFDDDPEYINTDWLTDDSFIGFCSEKVQREKEVENETHNGRIENVSILAFGYKNPNDAR